jgi:phosphoenolpyruvate carboxylase
VLNAPKEDVLADPIYSVDEDYIKEFFVSIRRFNEQVMNDPNYAALLDAFGANFLYPSGSRALKRQHDDLNLRINLTHPTQLRAIPHNGILQQLGFLANTLGGVGAAIVKDPSASRKSTRPRRACAACWAWWSGRWNAPSLTRSSRTSTCSTPASG